MIQQTAVLPEIKAFLRRFLFDMSETSFRTRSETPDEPENEAKPNERSAVEKGW